MKKATLLIVTALVLAICVPVFAQQFADVPTDHWAYAAIQQLAKAGIIQGYPDGTFGGKRAMTRYEFAQALAKAIPGIEAEIKSAGAGAGVQGPAGPEGPAGPAGPAGPQGPAGITPEQLATIQNMVNEFRDELASLGVDVAGLKRDLAALNQRVAAVEAEQARVKINGVIDVAGRGEVDNTGNGTFDRDFRPLATIDPAHKESPLANSRIFENFGLNIKGRVSDSVSANVSVQAGNYLPFALTPSLSQGSILGAALPSQADVFTLWGANIDAAVDLGFLGQTELRFGRMPFQLTPNTLKFVSPDSYTPIAILDSGDFALDGGDATFAVGTVNLTAFAFKPNFGNDFSAMTGFTSVGGGIPFALATPSLTMPVPSAVPAGGTPASTPEALQLNSLAGARAVIGTPFGGNLGLTYYRAGLTSVPTFLGTISGQQNIYGADLSVAFGGLGVSGEWDKSDPDSTLKNSVLTATAGTVQPTDLSSKDTNWNANLSFQTGSLGLKAGYTQVEGNYTAPGYWNRMGAVVNPTNIQGVTAEVNYAFTPGLSFNAAGEFLKPKDADVTPITFRTATTLGDPVPATITGADVNTINYWRAGLKYALTAANSVDLGYEELQISGTDSGSLAGLTAKERFVTIGVGHSFNPNTSLKLLYQIAEPVANISDSVNERGGVAAAQFNAKF